MAQINFAFPTFKISQVVRGKVFFAGLNHQEIQVNPVLAQSLDPLKMVRCFKLILMQLQGR
ncbi:hypothetical protein C1X65_17175 [Pseudomonas sp. FW305-70]|nr:hypothetical protein C1X65_17175 [Pseudomonas sp. FW305-70]